MCNDYPVWLYLFCRYFFVWLLSYLQLIFLHCWVGNHNWYLFYTLFFSSDNLFFFIVMSYSRKKSKRGVEDILFVKTPLNFLFFTSGNSRQKAQPLNIPQNCVRGCWQITFVMLNRICLLRKPLSSPWVLNAVDDIFHKFLGLHWMLSVKKIFVTNFPF